MSLRSRLLRIEKAAGMHRSGKRIPGDAMLTQLLASQIVRSYPGIELVEPEDTDPVTFAEIQLRLAQSEEEWDLADQWQDELRRLEPTLPCPPGQDSTAFYVAQSNRFVAELPTRTARTKAAIEAAKRRTAAASPAGESAPRSAC